MKPPTSRVLRCLKIRPVSAKFLIFTMNLILTTRHKMTLLVQKFVTLEAVKIGEGV